MGWPPTRGPEEGVLSLFAWEGRVSRGSYLRVGVSLMLLKYLAEACAVWFFCGQSYTPFTFINPLLESRARIAECAPAWFGIAWILWTLPFVWVAVSMSLRRAVDAGKSPWLAMMMLVPVMNLITMLFLAAWPSKEEAEQAERDRQELNAAWAPPQTDELKDVHPSTEGTALDGVKAAIGGIVIGVLYALTLTVLSVYLFDSYGAALFFGTPAVSGAASAYFYNRRVRRGIGATLGARHNDDPSLSVGLSAAGSGGRDLSRDGVSDYGATGPIWGADWAVDCRP